MTMTCICLHLVTGNRDLVNHGGRAGNIREVSFAGRAASTYTMCIHTHTHANISVYISIQAHKHTSYIHVHVFT